jgi:feruloyl esterase
MPHLSTRTIRRWSIVASVALVAAAHTLHGAQAPARAAVASSDEPIAIAAADCTLDTLGSTIPVEKIGEPVRKVTLSTAAWTAEAGNTPAYCRVDGVIDPVDTSTTARPINFAVALPARWNGRSVQMGGGGMNGTIPGLTGGGAGSSSLLARGIATYGSDSGHQAGLGNPGARGGPGRRGAGAPGAPGAPADAAPRRRRAAN